MARRWFRRRRFDEDLRDELAAHLDHRVDDLVRGGLTRAEARRRARVELGAVETYKDLCRETRPLSSWRTMPELVLRDVWHAARRLAAAPLFTLFAAGSLGLGLAATTTAYAVLHAALWTSPGVSDPDGLFVLSTSATAGRRAWRAAVSEPDYVDLARSWTDRALVAATTAFEDGLSGESDTEEVRAESVSGAYFAVVGVGPALGRVLSASDDAPDSPAVLVLSHRAWRVRHGSDPAIIGRTLRMGGQPVVVVGVAPEGFSGFGSQAGTDVWVSRAIATRHKVWTAARSRPLDRSIAQATVLLRPFPGAIHEVEASVHGIGEGLDAEYPRVRSTGVAGSGAPLPPRDWRIATLTDATTADAGRVAAVGYLAVGLVMLVLVVACSNIANLTLARGATRSHEITVRRALGASRGRLVRELCLESGMVAIAGGVLAFIATGLLLQVARLDLPIGNGRVTTLEPVLQGSVLVMAAAFLLASVIVFGLGPALRLTRGDVRPVLGPSVGVSGVPSRRLWRSTRWQVATTTTLFLVAAIMVRVIVVEARHDSGIDDDKLAVAVVVFDRARGQDAAYARRVVDDVLRRLQQTAGIESASASMGVPFGLTITPMATVTAIDAAADGGQASERFHMMPSTPEVFRTLGVPIVAGRPLDSADDITGASPVAVLSELGAREIFGRADASVLGRGVTVQAGGEPSTRVVRIVGIARDTDVQNALSRRSGLIYVPMSLEFSPGTAIFARSQDPGAAVGALRSAVREADRDLGVSTAGTAPVMLAGGYVLLRILSTVTLSLAGLALFLSMIGLYGVLSQVISRQTREMGIRMALGATANQIRRFALRQGLGPVLAGLVLGLALGVLVRAAVRFGMRAPIDVVDWAALAVVPVPLLATALVACYLPARRAARVNPNVALREF